MTIDQLVEILKILLPIAVAIVVPVYTLRKSAELQIKLRVAEIEREALRDRQNLENEVMLKSLDTVQTSFHHLRNLSVVISVAPRNNEESRKELNDVVRVATDYWETNYCYLPDFIRDKFVLVSNLAASCLSPQALKHGIDMKAGEEISKLFEEIKQAVAQHIDVMNPLSSRSSKQNV